MPLTAKKRGRPPRQIAMSEVVVLAKTGASQREIAAALRIEPAWFARWLNQDGRRETLNREVRSAIASVLQAQFDAAMRGDVASGNAVLRRLERRRF